MNTNTEILSDLMLQKSKLIQSLPSSDDPTTKSEDKVFKSMIELDFENRVLVSDIRSKQSVEYPDLIKIFRQYIDELYVLTYLTPESKNISFYYPNNETNDLYVEYIGYKGTPYHNGQYFIQYTLPKTYPNAPPSIRVLTESGRFQPDHILSLTISSYHPETWYTQSLEMVIINFISAFTDKDMRGVGHISSPDEDLIKYASQSREYNMIHYPDLCKEFGIIHQHKEAISTMTKDEKLAYIEKIKSI
jgi:ubiquitin-protein ligase